MSDDMIKLEANKRYNEYLVSTRRREFPGQRQMWLDGYITGLKHGLEFADFLSVVRRKKICKGEKYGKKRQK